MGTRDIYLANKENSYLESLHLFLLFFHGGFVTIVFQGSLKNYICACFWGVQHHNILRTS